jgi:hypothetical protein
MIGKCFSDVFPSRRSSTDLHSVAEDKGPVLLQNVLFSSTGELNPVYGKPVSPFSRTFIFPPRNPFFFFPNENSMECFFQLDILDADGRRSTVSVWSYQLVNPTTATCHQHTQRKTSAVIYLIFTIKTSLL